MKNKFIIKLSLSINILLIISLILFCYSFIHNNNHDIDLELIQRFEEEYSVYCYDQLANDNNHIKYKNDEERYLIFAALDEVLIYYRCQYDFCTEGHNNCIEIISRADLMTIDDSNYKTVIKDALYSMDRNCNDREMIKQINQWICDNLEYEITNGDLYKLFDDYKYKGQCYHYAELFRDMCNAVGINMKTCSGREIKGNGHVWNCCEINGVIYYFDVTWNDTSGTYDKYMFLTYEEIQKTHYIYKEENYNIY